MSLQLPSSHSTVETTGPCSRKVTIRVPASRVDSEFESTLKNVMGSVSFQGFRPGKAPRKLVEAKLGGKVLEEVKERLVQSALDDAIKEHKLEPVGNPRMEWNAVKIERGHDLAFDIAVDVRPVFDVPKLDLVKVKRPDLTVTEKHVDDEIERLRLERATTADGGDEPLRDNGIATMGVKIVCEGETVVDADDVEWQLGTDVLGGMQVEGLSKGLTGKKKGETAEFALPLPEDFRDEKYRGKQAALTLRVDRVQHVTLPPADDAFAKEMDYDDVAEMRAELRKKLERDAESNKDAALDAAIVDTLLDTVPFEVPPSLVQTETERMLRRYEMQLRRQGVPEQDINLQIQHMIGAAASKVTRDLRASFLLDRIATDRKVFVTENEMRQEIGRMAGRYDRSTNDMEEHLQSQNLLSALRGEMRERKTVAELRGVVKIEDAAPPAVNA